MECPYCHVELQEPVKKYCPVCGRDILGYASGPVVTPDAPQTVAPDITVQAEPVQSQQASSGMSATSSTTSRSSATSAQRLAAANAAVAPFIAAKNSTAASSGALPFDSPVIDRTISPSAPAKNPRWPLALMGILIALIAILLLLILWPKNNASKTSTTDAQQSGTAAVQTQSSQGVSVDNPAQDMADTSVSVEQGIATLRDAYSELTSLDSQVSGAASTFNDAYLSPDVDERRAHADDAAALLTHIWDVKASVDGIDTTSLNQLEYAQSQISLMLDCLAQRTEVIAEAWNLSADSADPSAVFDEISAILGRDNDSAGVNVYKTRFNELLSSFDLDAALADA